MKGDSFWIEQMLDRIGRIEAIVAKGKDAFDADVVLQDALIRNIEVVGESVKNLSTEVTKLDHDWKAAAGMKDILIHAYFRVDLDLVWQTAVTRMPELGQLLSSFSEAE